MKRILLAVTMAAGILGGMVSNAHAASHRGSPPSSGCTISASQVVVGDTYVVSIAGLPALTAINLVVTDGRGTTASPLGSTPDGSFALNESSSVAGTTTYQFTGATKTNNTQVYGTCSVSAR